MADCNGILSGQRGNTGRGNSHHGGQQGGCGNWVTWQNVSQYGNTGYKGPAPMVLGNVGDVPVCYYCNKPGHLRRDCHKLRNDLTAGRGAGGNSSRGGRGGRNRGGRSSLNVIA